MITGKKIGLGRAAGAHGYSLAEVVVTVGIISILAALSIPALRYTMNSKALAAAGREVYGALRLAQLNAVRENRNCALLFTATGYQLFLDLDKNYTFSSGDRWLGAEMPWAKSNSQVNAEVSGFVSSGTGRAVAFRPSMAPARPSGGGGLPNGTITLKNPRMASEMRVCVGTAGSVRLTRCRIGAPNGCDCR